MSVAVTLHDEAVPGGERRPGFRLVVDRAHVTARDVLAARVAEELARDAPRPLMRWRDRPTSLDAAVDAAERAFARNGFLMLLGDRQVQDLDEVLSRGETIDVVFVRLLPLVGG